MPTVLFTPQDVRLFAGASHDYSPLHVDAAYARRTSFGRTVVHGVLAALTAVSHLAPRRTEEAVTKIAIDFQGPIFEDTAYDVEIKDTGPKVKVSVRDGTKVVLRASLVRGPGTPAELTATEGARPRESARGEDVVVGRAIDAAYAPERAPLDALITKLDLRARGLGSSAVAAMMAASYVVGMECPGAQALFARLELSFALAPSPAPAHVRAVVTTLDERFAMATLDVELCGARGEIRALVRPRPVVLDAARMDEAFARHADTDVRVRDAFTGKTAVVIGGGRGLGASIALALAKCGARVIATYAGSRETAASLVALDDRIEVVQADATDAEACARIVEALGDARIDVIVLSASPPVLPLALADGTANRALAFVERAVAMALVPIAVLGGRSLAPGCKLVAISSSYVTEPPPDFAHYVAAKGAIEGLLRGVAKDRQLPLVVARPPRVLTDMTNTPFGAEDALRAEDVAVSIVRAVATHREGTLVLENFGGAPS